ncbi:MAG: NAD(P)/FAD-dependent oxidoreductase [Pseudomonadota bacterium]
MAISARTDPARRRSRAEAEIAVAGAGPAGLAVALALSARGRSVRLFDQFEAPAPVGSGLMMQPAGLAALDAIAPAAGARLRRLGQPIARLYGRAVRAPGAAQPIVLDVRYDALGAGAESGLAVHRAALFGVLWDAAQAAGVAVTGAARLTAIEPGGADPSAGVRLRAADGRQFGPFDLVIDASGARSTIRDRALGRRPPRSLAYGALWSTVPWDAETAAPFAPDALEQRYRRAATMIGVLPVGRMAEDGPPVATFFWSLKPEQYDAWRARGLEAWRREAAALWPETAPILARIEDPDQMTLARYAHFTLARPYLGRVVWIGDSAHAASPQLGQGANMALLDALALARAIDAAPDLEAALEAYAAARRWHVRLYQLMSRLFTPVYQSDSRALPWIRDRVMAPASRAPGAPALLARLVSGGLIDPFGPMPPDGRDRSRPWQGVG